MNLLRAKRVSVLHTQIMVIGFICLSLLLQSAGAQDLWCSDKEERNPGQPLPDFPQMFSARIQVNYESHGFSSEITRKRDAQNKRDYTEVYTGTRHVVYISSGNDDSLLTINYSDEGTVCTTDLLSQIDKRSAFDQKDTGPLGILQLVEERIFAKKDGFILQNSRDYIRGIPAISWKLCESFPELGTAVNIILYFADKSWKPAYPKYSKDGESKMENGLIRIQAHAKGVSNGDKDEILFIADYYDYQELPLKDKDFQAPETVHCPGYRGRMKSSIDTLNYFSYKSEMINYTTVSEVAPVVSHRTVYYDLRSGLARVDYKEPLERKDSYSELDTKVRTVIYDFKLGIQYSFEPLFGGCSVEVMKNSLDVFGPTELKNSAASTMLDPSSFFYLKIKSSEQPLSYKGVYETRGLPVDAFSRQVQTSGKRQTYFWYFTSDDTKLIEEDVERNVLVKMVSRPETGSGSIGREQIEINFYDFVKDEPSGAVFDITQCYNESLVKEYVIRFPGEFEIFVEDALYLLKVEMERILQNVTGVSRQRISIQQIYFRSPYLLVQFKILDHPIVDGFIPSSKESTLEKAAELLQNAINNGRFIVEFRTSDNRNIILQPEPDGLKEFKGERGVPVAQVYNESSFVGMSIGMTVLGFLLGGIVINLIITKKYGVSLFQRTGQSSDMNFNNPLNESSM